MPTYCTSLPDNIYLFLDRMSELYSAVEHDMHVALMRGEKIATVEKSLQAKYQVDSTTTRNVYHNLKGKHQGILDLKKTQIRDLKSTVKSISSAIKKRFRKKVITQKVSQAIGQVIDLAVEYQCPIIIEKLDFSSKKNKLKEGDKGYVKMLSGFAYSKFANLVQSKCKLKAIQVISVNPAYSSLIGMVKYMSLYGLNSGTSAALVLARRSFRFSERLPRVLNALFTPVDVNKHVWSYWARISKLVKGCYRHSYFGMRVRVEVKPNNQNSVKNRKLLGKSNDTSKIPSNINALDVASTKFTQLCLDF